MAEKLVNTADFSANAPATADEVIVQDITAVDVTVNVDQKGDYYDSMEASRNFIHDLGASGAPLRCNAAKLRLLHGGDAWVTSDDNNGAGSQAMDDWLVDLMSESHTAYLASSLNAQHADSVWHRGGIRVGIVAIETSVIFGANARISIGTGGVVLKLAAETVLGTALPRLAATGGMIESDRTVADAQIENCTMRQQTNPITYATVGPGGILKYWHTAGTLIEVLAGGTLDLTEKRRQRTIPIIIARKGSTLLDYESNLHIGTLIDER